MNTFKIGIADNQQIFRKGLVMLLNKIKNYEVIFDEENGSDLLDQMAGVCPDIVILDYQMPLMGGVETSKEIRKRFPSVRILILSQDDNDEFVENAINNGVNGYLSKNDDLKEIESAIQELMINHYYINDRVSKVFINTLVKNDRVKPFSISKKIEFTQDEIKILNMISKEFTTKQISEALFKGTRTIEKHKTRMMEKVGAKNSIGLVMYAVRDKIIEV